MKICGKDSTENFNEQTIDMMWFFVLDSIFKIKADQLKVLERLRDEEHVNNLPPKSEKKDDEDSLDTKESLNKYDVHLQNLIFFFKSRISYVIENTLKYIELSDFLDHIVMKDRHIKYQELSEMI